MIPVQNDLAVSFLKSLAQATGATATSQTIDTVGYRAANLIFEVNGGAGTALSPTIQIQESDTTDATAFATISGLSLTTSTSGYPSSVTAATALTSAFSRINIDLKGRKRYLRALVGGSNVSTGVTVNVFGVAVLTRAAESPTGTNTGGRFVATI
jgi:hypothetical protein